MTRVERLRKIVDDHQAATIDGLLIDATTANMLVTVHDGLRPDLHGKFERISLPRLVEFGWRHVRVG